MSNIADFIQYRDDLKTRINVLKRELADADESINEHFTPKARAKLAESGLDTGTVRLIEGNREYKISVAKKVTWDAEQLSQIFDEMDPDEARHYAKISLSVEERKFTAAPPHIQERLSAARTLEIGRVSVELVEE